MKHFAGCCKQMAERRMLCMFFFKFLFQDEELQTGPLKSKVQRHNLHTRIHLFVSLTCWSVCTISKFIYCQSSLFKPNAVLRKKIATALTA